MPWLRFWTSRADYARMSMLHAQQEAIICSQKERIDGLVQIMQSKNVQIEWLENEVHELRMLIRATEPPPLPEC